MGGAPGALVPADVLPVRRRELALRPRPATRTAAALMLGLFVLTPGAQGAGFDPNRVDVALRPVGTGFDRPVLLTNAGDGSRRLFVVEQPGYVRILSSGTSGTPFLDVQARVACCGERGLLGLAFHPDFETNGKLYVDYTRSADGATVIDEYRVTSNP